MTLKWDDKDPNEVLDYDLDWTDRLSGDLIATSAWDVASGSVIINSSQKTSTVTKVWLSGGDEGDVCDVHNRVTTTGGRTWDQTVRLKIKSR